MITLERFVNLRICKPCVVCALMIIDANYFFAKNSEIPCFDSELDERTIMCAHIAGLYGLAILSMPHVFNVDIEKFAELTFCINLALITLIIRILTLDDATFRWKIALVEKIVIAITNFYVIDMKSLKKKFTSIKCKNFLDTQHGYCTPNNYFDFKAIYNIFFMIGFNADAMFGTNSIIGKSFFDSVSDPKALFVCQLSGILGLFYSSAYCIFNIDALKLAKLDLVLNIALFKVQHDIVFNGLQGATSKWNIQLFLQKFVIVMNAAVVVFNTKLSKRRST